MIRSAGMGSSSPAMAERARIETPPRNSVRKTVRNFIIQRDFDVWAAQLVRRPTCREFSNFQATRLWRKPTLCKKGRRNEITLNLFPFRLHVPVHEEIVDAADDDQKSCHPHHHVMISALHQLFILSHLDADPRQDAAPDRRTQKCVKRIPPEIHL